MLVRVAVNVTMTMQPFYLEKTLKFKVDLIDRCRGNNDVDCLCKTPFELSAVPLGAYVTSLIFSIWF
jgi:hypothetical protein